ncbi:MAG: calmodulin-binding protein [Pirellulaceae bacterium]|nr:calmodulin-binding protein [Pirellulaceae bacterium]
MLRFTFLTIVGTVLLSICSADYAQAQDTRAFGRIWGRYHTQDWERHYYYPYVYYPQNFKSLEYYRSGPDMMNRYPKEMRIPLYNQRWHNYYPQNRRYHSGHHFLLDVF